MPTVGKIQNSCRVQNIALLANIVLLNLKRKKSRQNEWKSFCERMAVTILKAKTLKKSRISKVKIDYQQRHVW